MSNDPRLSEATREEIIAHWAVLDETHSRTLPTVKVSDILALFHIERKENIQWVKVGQLYVEYGWTEPMEDGYAECSDYCARVADV